MSDSRRFENENYLTGKKTLRLSKFKDSKLVAQPANEMIKRITDSSAEDMVPALGTTKNIYSLGDGGSFSAFITAYNITTTGNYEPLQMTCGSVLLNKLPAPSTKTPIRVRSQDVRWSRRKENHRGRSGRYKHLCC